jgi:hypothetical protein
MPDEKNRILLYTTPGLQFEFWKKRLAGHPELTVAFHPEFRLNNLSFNVPKEWTQPDRVSEFKRLISSGLFPIWRVSQLKPDSYQKWVSESGLPDKPSKKSDSKVAPKFKVLYHEARTY